MKNLSFLVFCFGISFAYGQALYDELPDSNPERYEILHVFDDGTIIAKRDFPLDIFVSTDLGESWQNLNIGTLELQYLGSSRFHINAANEYFISVGHQVFEINLETFTFDLYFEFESSIENIEDFNFFPNGNFVVAENRSFQLYDSNLNLIRKIDWWTHSALILIGDNGNNYVSNSLGAGYSIIKFDDNLFITTPKMSFPFIRNGFEIFEGRIFSINGYSDDGGATNQPYNIPTNSSVRAVDILNNRVIVLTTSNLYISTDKGISFAPMNNVEFSTFNQPYLFSLSGIALEYYSQSSSTLNISENNGTNFNSNNLALGTEFSISSATDHDGNIIRYNNYNSQTYDPSTGQWQMAISNDCYTLGSNLALATGSIISGECISHDGGKTWNSLPPLPSGYIIDQNEILYDLEYLFLKSCDYGVSWEQIFEDLFPSSFGAKTFVTADGNLIKFDDDFQQPTLNFYTKSGEIIPIILTGFIQDIIPAYSSSEVYYKTIQNNNYILSRSINGYNNMQQLTLPNNIDDFNVNVDFLNNIYLLTDKLIFVSSDQGNTWNNISPIHDDIIEIQNLSLGRDMHIYISTIGTSVLKSVEPIGSINSVEVVTFSDINSNCVYDNNEPLLNGFELTFNGNIKRVTNEISPIIFQTISKDNTVAINTNLDLYDVCEFDSEVEFTDQNNNSTLFIPVSIIKECTQLEVNASTPRLRRCFDNVYTFEVKNIGSLASENIIVDVELDEYFDYLSCTSPATLLSNQTLKVEVESIPPNSSSRFHIEFNLSCDSELGTVHYINSSIEIQNPCTEEDLTTSFECRENIGSFDPNDKQPLINGIANIEILEEQETLEYLIRFQNTGTDTAFTVRIEDRLSSAFDLSTLSIVSASHDYIYEIDRRNLIVTFDNIELPDSTTNQLASNGFVKFKVNLEEDISPGDYFSNRADIYFDFNEAITTNFTHNYYICKNQSIIMFDTICPGEDVLGFTESGFYEGELETVLGCDSTWFLALTVLDEDAPDCLPLAVENDNTTELVKLFPNPTSGQIYIHSMESKIISARLLSISGQFLEKYKIDQNEIQVDVPSGVYLLEMLTDNHLTLTRKITILQ